MRRLRPGRARRLDLVAALALAAVLSGGAAARAGEGPRVQSFNLDLAHLVDVDRSLGFGLNYERLLLAYSGILQHVGLLVEGAFSYEPADDSRYGRVGLGFRMHERCKLDGPFAGFTIGFGLGGGDFCSGTRCIFHYLAAISGSLSVGWRQLLCAGLSLTGRIGAGYEHRLVWTADRSELAGTFGTSTGKRVGYLPLRLDLELSVGWTW